MEIELEGLEKWGAHPEEAIERLLGDKMLYRQLIREFGETNDIDLLRFRLEQMDYNAAFRIAHSMKGAAVSLSLTPLTEALGKLVEQLRPWYEGELDAAPELLREPMLYHMQQVDRKWSEYCGLVL